MSLPQILVAAPTDTASGQAAQIANLARLVQAYASEIASLSALPAAPALPAPVLGQPYDNPHTDDTHLVFAHYQVSNFLRGTIPAGGVGSVAGYEADIDEAMAAGYDGFWLDAGSLTGNYALCFDNLFAAADNRNAPNLQTDGTYKSNGHGVRKFSLCICPDFSGIGEDQSSIQALGTFFLKYASRPSCFTFQGRPVLSTYTGDGGGVPKVASVYPPLLAQIRAAGVNVLFLPGFGNAANSLAAGGEGDWSYVGGCPLGSGSFLPSQEALAASVKSTLTSNNKPLLWMQAHLPYGYWDGNGRNGSFYNEFDGLRSCAAQWMSTITSQQPDFVQSETWNDGGEGSAISVSASQAYLPGRWPYITNGNVPDFYQDTSGLKFLNAYFIQWYKTGRQPQVQTDTILVSNRTQTAAASHAPTADSLGAVGNVTNPLGMPAGLQDIVSAATLLKKGGNLRLSNVGSVQQSFAPSGLNFFTFSGVTDGTPLLELVQNGQVTKQVTGHVIRPAPQPLCNLNAASAASVPGVSFTVSAPVPMPALPVDRAGLMVRSTSTSYRALGACDFVATDLAPATPVIFAQNTLQDPAALNGTLSQSKLANSTAAGQDVLKQYNGYAYVGLYPSPLDPTQSLGYIQSPANIDAVNSVNKPLPSSHIKVQVRAVYTKADPDGIVGPALVCSTGDTYDGRGYVAQVQVYAGAWTLALKAVTNFNGDTNSAGPVVLASIPINSLALGEWYDIYLTTDGTTLTATAVPSNQQL